MPSIAMLTMDAAAACLEERKAAIAISWAAYYGRMDKPFPQTHGKADDNVRLNFARLIVDKGASFLFGQSVDFEAGGEESAAETWLDAVWTANRQATLLNKLAINGGVTGHAWIKIATQPAGPPRLIVLDPETVSVAYLPDDYETVIEYRIDTKGVDPYTRKAQANRQVISKQETGWRIIDQVSKGDSPSWQTTGDVLWPYDWPPIIGCQNLPAPNEYWGVSDLEVDIIEVMRAINSGISNLNRMLRLNAHPRILGSGITDPRQLNVAPDNMMLLPPGTSISALDLKIGAQRAWIDYYETLKEALHELARVPEVATGKVDNIGTLSGVALQILYQPLLEKTAQKRMTYGDMLQELNTHLLELGGFAEPTSVRWPKLSPVDDMTDPAIALQWKTVGVSTKTLLDDAGFNAEVEMQQRKEEGQMARDASASALNLPDGTAL